MPVMIQTAGRPTPKRKYVRGPDAPNNAIILNVRHLPNPYGKIDRFPESTRLERIKEFLHDRCPQKVERLVNAGKDAIKQSLPVVIVCTHGKDRSRAIAQMIGDSFHPSRVYYVHREA